jgi:D-arabinitol 4-dehydrogenase
MDAARAHAICAAADPLTAFVAEPSLWGELAGRIDLRDAVAAATVDLRNMLGDSSMT